MKKGRIVAVMGAAFALAMLAPLPLAFAGGEGCEDCCSTTKAMVREVKLQEVRAISSRKQKGFIVDSRGAADYKAGHIPGAVSVPMEKLQSGLPKNKASRIVFYCGGERCPLSHMAAEKALKLGYKNVAVYKGGWTGWTQTASR
jgi:rhodanese-related sulfurtransferase